MSRPLTAAERRTTLDHLHIAHATAARIKRATLIHVDFDDLKQSACLGLIQAAKRFDAKRGIKFNTYAAPRARGATIDSLRRTSWPRRMRANLPALKAAIEEFGFPDTPFVERRIALRLKIKITTLRRRIAQMQALQATVSNDAMSVAILPAWATPRPSESPEESCEKAITAARLREAIDALPPRRRKAILLRYFQDKTMAEVGAALHVNESRASQIHADAVARLRALLGDSSGRWLNGTALRS